jgi:hypothetical protein
LAFLLLIFGKKTYCFERKDVALASKKTADYGR